MTDKFAAFRAATGAALFDSAGTTSKELRRELAAGGPPPELSELVHKIRSRAYTVTDADLEALKSVYSEDQLFEIVVAAVFGAATDRLTAARRALEEA